MQTYPYIKQQYKTPRKEADYKFRTEVRPRLLS